MQVHMKLPRASEWDVGAKLGLTEAACANQSLRVILRVSSEGDPLNQIPWALATCM